MLSARCLPSKKCWLLCLGDGDNGAAFARSSDQFLGKIKFNARGTVFSLLDNGLSAKKLAAASSSKKLHPERPERQELARCTNTPNTTGPARPQHIEYALPETDSARAVTLQPPDFGTNPITGQPMLDFGGRVRKGSVKNTQLVDADTDSSKILLQFGRTASRTEFILDFQYPLSPVQAFALALTRLTYKVTAEGG